MEEEKILHGILLKKAKEAQYTNFEIEQLNLQSESLFIRYFLEREAARIVENTNIEEDVLKKIYEENQTLYKFPKKVKIDTIFVKDLAKAEEILKEVNLENFNELKDKNDEKGQEAKGVTDEFLFITEIHPAIAEEILQENGKNVIIKKAIPVQEGFHILYLKDIEEERQAIFDEARETILADVKRNIFGQVYNQLIEDIANETVRPKDPVKIDTIFVKDLAKAEEILKEVNLENFNELKEKNDEKGQEAKGVTDEFLFVTEIHPAIAEEILSENQKNIIIKKAIPVQEGFHILYLKDIEEERQAIFDEARETILADVKRNIFGQVYNQLIEDIANETVKPKEPIKIIKNKEDKSTETKSKQSKIKDNKKNIVIF